MKDYRKLSEEYTEIGIELIRTEQELMHIKNSNVQIGFLNSPIMKRSKVLTTYAVCERVPDKYKWSIPFDFLITVFDQSVKDFTDDQIRILLFHELLHVGIEEANGEEKYFTVPHDLEDFKLIVDKFGARWSE